MLTWEGWRTQAMHFFPWWAPRAWARPIVVVLLPSPRGVGLIPATTTYFPLGLSASLSASDA